MILRNYFFGINNPQIKKPASTMVDTIVIASNLTLRNDGILLTKSKPNTTYTARIYFVLFIIHLYFKISFIATFLVSIGITTIMPSFGMEILPS
jgi:hypothetical protein